MQMQVLDIDNSINNKNEINQNLGIRIYEAQQSFLQTSLGKAVNTAIDIGLKSILPDLIEDEVIDIKDCILENGFKSGVEEILKSGIDFGKSVSGIITGNFESIEQVQMAVKNGGILDKTSELLDNIINFVKQKNLINNTTASLIKQGKNSIISSISNKVEETLTNQIKAVDKIEKFTKNWNIAYGIQDFEKMEVAYKNIKNNLEKVLPLERIINNARTIENIHNLIKNNGKSFNLTEDEIKLAQIL
ncbi:MAG: hypothetical protein IKL55_04005 [Clostridia bacterium]|nr:hypothetical protein [Clostridia bacterium]